MPQVTYTCAHCAQPRTRYVHPRLPMPRYCSHACLHAAMRAGRHVPHATYTFTPVMDQAIRTAFWQRRGGLAQLARTPEFAHLPAHAVKERAKALGLVRTVHQQVWEPEELAFCLQHWGAGMRLDALARQMQRRGWHRSKSAILAMLARQHAPRRHGLLSLSQVAQGIGVDDHVVARWVRQDLLPLTPTEHTRTRFVTPAALRRFCMAWPGEVAKGAPNTVWLIALLTDAEAVHNGRARQGETHGD